MDGFLNSNTMKDIQLFNEEVWKDIPNFDFYESSSLGRIRSKNHYAFVKKWTQSHTSR